jgi:hypothetical protein
LCIISSCFNLSSRSYCTKKNESNAPSDHSLERTIWRHNWSTIWKKRKNKINLRLFVRIVCIIVIYIYIEYENKKVVHELTKRKKITVGDDKRNIHKDIVETGLVFFFFFFFLILKYNIKLNIVAFRFWRII